MNMSETYDRLQEQVLNLLGSLELLRIRSTNEGADCFAASMKVSLASSLAFEALSSLKAPGRVRGAVITEDDFQELTEYIRNEAATRAISCDEALRLRFAFVERLCTLAEKQIEDARIDLGLQ